MIEQFGKASLATRSFCQRAYSTLEAIPTTEIRIRTNPDTKALLEEVLPMAAFAKYMEQPGRLVRVRHFGGNKPFDGRIYFSGDEVSRGFLEDCYHLEITSAVSPDDYLYREAIERQGSVFLGGPIRRVGSRSAGKDRIEVEPMAVDGSAAISELAGWCLNAIAKKLKKSYPTPCILLIGCHPSRKLNPIEWAEVVKQVASGPDTSKFSAVYLVQAWDNIVLPAWMSNSGQPVYAEPSAGSLSS